MPAKRVIPCLDVTAGRVVKGVRFVDLKDAGDPAELAAAYSREGADELVFLDITASSNEREILLDAVARTADEVFIPLTVGGGVRSTDDIQSLLSHGADKVSVNSAALADPTLLTRGAEIFGSQCVVLAIDARRREAGAGWEVYSHGDGYDVELTAAVAAAVRLPVIASGGAGSAAHMYQALTEGGAEAALAASIFHFGELSIAEVKEELANRGLEVRR